MRGGQAEEPALPSRGRNWVYRTPVGLDLQRPPCAHPPTPARGSAPIRSPFSAGAAAARLVHGSGAARGRRHRHGRLPGSTRRRREAAVLQRFLGLKVSPGAKQLPALTGSQHPRPCWDKISHFTLN